MLAVASFAGMVLTVILSIERRSIATLAAEIPDGGCVTSHLHLPCLYSGPLVLTLHQVLGAVARSVQEKRASERITQEPYAMRKFLRVHWESGHQSLAKFLRYSKSSIGSKVCSDCYRFYVS